MGVGGDARAMRKVRATDAERMASPASVRRAVADAVGAENVAVNYYELEPGDSFAFGYHSHAGQEEVFYVLDGTATFETDDGEVVVEEGEAVRFAPGERQQGHNRTDDRVVALALGAPKDAPGGSELFRDCPDCGERTPHGLEKTDGGRVAVTTCRECGVETGRYTV